MNFAANFPGNTADVEGGQADARMGPAHETATPGRRSTPKLGTSPPGQPAMPEPTPISDMTDDEPPAAQDHPFDEIWGTDAMRNLRASLPHTRPQSRGRATRSRSRELPDNRAGAAKARAAMYRSPPRSQLPSASAAERDATDPL